MMSDDSRSTRDRTKN